MEHTEHIANCTGVAIFAIQRLDFYVKLETIG